MKKLVSAALAVLVLSVGTPALADGYYNGNHYNGNRYHKNNGDPWAYGGAFLGGMLIGGLLSNGNRGVYYDEPRHYARPRYYEQPRYYNPPPRFRYPECVTRFYRDRYGYIVGQYEECY